jgi:polyisoprenoid-binding protein YceI
MQRMLLLLAATLVAAPAVAQEKPQLRPTRDVVVQYTTGGATRAAGSMVTMHFANRGRRVRVDPANATSYSVFDIDAHSQTVVRTDARTFEDRPSDPSQVPLYFSPEATFVKTGVETIAGLRCTTYDATLHNRTGQICLTDDGVILRARTGQNDSVRELVAVSVTYAEQPVALFAPPDGYRNADISPNLSERRQVSRMLNAP